MATNMDCDDTRPAIPDCDNKNTISEMMDSMRQTQSSVRRTTNEYKMFCFIGFASIARRDALIRVVNWALQPLLTYSAFVKDIQSQEFEAIIVTKKQIDMNAVEEWLGLFNMGICCIEFEQYMQPAMVTCISRIHYKGKHWYGSFKTKQSARVRRDFYKQYTKREQENEQQRVLEVTGMTVTPRNMLALHGRLASMQTYVRFLERENESSRHARDSAVADAGAPQAQPAVLQPTAVAPPSYRQVTYHVERYEDDENRPQTPRVPPPSPPPPPPPPLETFAQGYRILRSPQPSSPQYRTSSPQISTPAYVRVVGVPFVLRPGPRTYLVGNDTVVAHVL